MKRSIVHLLLYLGVLFLCMCPLKGAEGDSAQAAEKRERRINVRSCGAVGDARYHYPLGIRGGMTENGKKDNEYWAGHFSRLVTTVYREPGQGDEEGIVRYKAADEEKSVFATDDSEAFEKAIRLGGGNLFLPEGDYMISQITAAKIRDITGPGKIWLKEWKGGDLWYLQTGTSDLCAYSGYGWIDAAHFHDPVWRSMHWTGCLADVHGWERSEEFCGNFSPRVEYAFDESRDNINLWLTITPAVSREEFPESVTICIGTDASAFYTLEGETRWKKACEGGIEGTMFHSAWNGEMADMDALIWEDCGEWMEVTVLREDFFPDSGKAGGAPWLLHCWSVKNKSLTDRPVEFTMGYARVWLKDKRNDNCVMCDIGGDMRPPYGVDGTNEFMIHEAYNSVTDYLTKTPKEFYAYNVTDEKYDEYLGRDFRITE